jgi:hypothetical protein
MAEDGFACTLKIFLIHFRDSISLLYRWKESYGRRVYKMVFKSEPSGHLIAVRYSFILQWYIILR